MQCLLYLGLCFGSSNIILLQPNGAIGVALKSNMTLRWEYIDILGHMHESCRRLSVISVCFSSFSHTQRKKFGFTIERPDIKWHWRCGWLVLWQVYNDCTVQQNSTLHHFKLFCALGL